MKRMKLALFSALLAAAGVVSAGWHVNGSVTATSTYLSGSMNVRYNSGSSAYIYAYGFANSSVTFAGRGDDGTFFSCYVPTTSALYAQAVDIKNNLTNGGYLYASKREGSSECTSAYLLNGSYWLD